MSKGILFLIFLLIPVIAYGQAEKPDTVLLKSGTQLVGKTVIDTDNCKIELTTSFGQTFSLSLREIKTINGKLPYQIEAIRTNCKESLDSLQSLKAAVLVGADLYVSESMGGACITTGLMFIKGRIFTFGLGTGIDFNSKNFALPIYLNFQLAFLKRPGTPFIFFDPGYILSLEGSAFASGGNIRGIYMNFGVGYRSKLKKGVFFGLGIRTVGMKSGSSSFFFLPRISSDTSTSISFRLGFSI